MIIERLTGATTDKEADSINEPLCVDLTALRARGYRFLADPDLGGYKKVKRYDLQVPYRAGLIPGKVIAMSCDKLGLVGEKMIVRSVRLSGAFDNMWANISCDRIL